MLCGTCSSGLSKYASPRSLGSLWGPRRPPRAPTGQGCLRRESVESPLDSEEGQLWCLLQKGAALRAPGLGGRKATGPFVHSLADTCCQPAPVAVGLAPVLKRLGVTQASLQLQFGYLSCRALGELLI